MNFHPYGWLPSNFLLTSQEPLDLCWLQTLSSTCPPRWSTLKRNSPGMLERTPKWDGRQYRLTDIVGLDGILVSGIGISAQRDAQPLVRMQPDVQNQGYAAGVAAAMAAK